MNRADRGEEGGEEGPSMRRRMSGWETESLREGRVDIYRPSLVPFSPSPLSLHAVILPFRPHWATTYHPHLVQSLRIVRLPCHPHSRALPYTLRRILTLEPTPPFLERP